MRVLPPINDRHLPDIYVNIMGMVVFAILAYLLFNIIVEKRSFKLHKKSYVTASILLILAPLMIAGIFRVHAVNLVAKMEGTTPVKIVIAPNSKGSSIMFAAGSSSAGGVNKSGYITEPYLEDFGKAIGKMELKEVVDGEEQKQGSHYLTMWIDYEVAGEWYSKILSYVQGMFEEHVAGERIAYYSNPELENLLKKVFDELADINNYDRAGVINYVTINKGNKGEEKERLLTPNDFQVLVNSLKTDNLINQDTEGVNRIKKALDGWIPKEEMNIYGIELFKKGSAQNVGQNFMVYDKLTHTLLFEDKYYQVDLDDIVK
ncbi:hypothetical protein [Desulfofarcimen acetoxidans]|uniref:hypothetical protein n=1 Tax=Desulfofarcimen acetoxidans TaxID=58138 RepID=UPI001F620D06|nr:hypothetical protein [Desulfofarcimen acetoxidans]